MSSNEETTSDLTTQSTSLSEKPNSPTLSGHVKKVLRDGELLPIVSRGLEFVAGKYDLIIDNDVKSSVAYALEEENVQPEQVPALMRHFLMSNELRNCVRYNRKPTPRDFLDVWNRVGPRSR